MNLTKSDDKKEVCGVIDSPSSGSLGGYLLSDTMTRPKSTLSAEDWHFCHRIPVEAGYQDESPKPDHVS
jgi:hypothetical protein